MGVAGSAGERPTRSLQTLVTIRVRNDPSSVARALEALDGVIWAGDIGSGQVRVLFDPSRVSLGVIAALAHRVDGEMD